MTPSGARVPDSFLRHGYRNMGGRLPAGVRNSGNLVPPDLRWATCRCGWSTLRWSPIFRRPAFERAVRYRAAGDCAGAIEAALAFLVFVLIRMPLSWNSYYWLFVRRRQRQTDWTKIAPGPLLDMDLNVVTGDFPPIPPWLWGGVHVGVSFLLVLAARTSEGLQLVRGTQSRVRLAAR